METTIVNMKARVGFPVRQDETFNVKDGNGKVVEIWRHLKSAPRGKTHETHTYEVEGYRAVL